MTSPKDNEKKTKTINFRIPESVWEAAHDRAVLAGKSVNEWVRDGLIGQLDEHTGMTPGERLMYVEMNNLRNLVEKMMLAGMNAENEEEFSEALEQSIEHREAAAREYFKQLAEVGSTSNTDATKGKQQ
jgi:predicted DNA binding CopG/RHH family protein